MDKIIRIIMTVLLLGAGVCSAQNIKSIEGTTWRGVDNGRETEVTFLPNGNATYSFHNGVSIMTNNNIKWAQNGNNVYWEINNKFVEKNGQIKGDTYSGSAKNAKGLEWTFSYRLVASNAGPFNPSKELAIEQNKIMAQRQAGGNPPQQTAQLAAPAPQAEPQIKKVVKLKNGNEAFFYPTSIIKKGKVIEVKTGMDIEGCGKFDDLNAVVCSIVYLDSFICSESKGKRLSGSFMTGHFGGGNIIKTSTTQEEYEVIKPNTGNSLMLEAVCKG